MAATPTRRAIPLDAGFGAAFTQLHAFRLAERIRSGVQRSDAGKSCIVSEAVKVPFPGEGWEKGNFGNLKKQRGYKPCVA